MRTTLFYTKVPLGLLLKIRSLYTCTVYADYNCSCNRMIFSCLIIVCLGNNDKVLPMVFPLSQTVLCLILKKFFDHEMTLEYAKDKPSSSPRGGGRGGRGGFRGGFSDRGRGPPRGPPFRGPPPGRGPPSRSGYYWFTCLFNQANKVQLVS